MTLWLLALAGAISSWLGDICGVLAVRRGTPWGIIPTAILFGCAAPMWYAMTKMTHGQFVKPAMIWSCASSVLTLIAALTLDGSYTPRQWAGLILFFLALIVRG